MSASGGKWTYKTVAPDGRFAPISAAGALPPAARKLTLPSELGVMMHARVGDNVPFFEAHRATAVGSSCTRFGSGGTRLRLPPFGRQGYML